MRDGLLRVGEVAALVWEDIEFMPDGCGLLHIRRSKTDQKGEGKTQLLSPLAVKDLRAAIPHGPMDPQALVFGISADWLGRRIRQVCEHVGLEPGYSGHSCRVGMAQDLAAANIGMAVLMESGRWGSGRNACPLSRLCPCAGSWSTRFTPQALLCTDPSADPARILEWFVLRWQLEVTFQEVRAHLGVETQRQWSDLAIARTTPILMGLFSWTTLAAHLLRQQRPSAHRTAAWYAKPQPTFVDAIALVRRHLWLASEGFSLSRRRP